MRADRAGVRDAKEEEEEEEQQEEQEQEQEEEEEEGRDDHRVGDPRTSVGGLVVLVELLLEHHALAGRGTRGHRASGPRPRLAPDRR